MIRVVLDTNILVSTALPRSRLQPVVAAWQQRRCRVLISPEIFDEYLRVLTYPKFRLSSDEIRRIVEREILPYTELVHVTSQFRVVTDDPSDDKFLACAVDGHAGWLVTGDRHLLVLRTFRGVRIGPPAAFLQALQRA